jgi:hypothetical protein
VPQAGQRETPMLFVDDEFAGGCVNCAVVLIFGGFKRLLTKHKMGQSV